MTLIRSHLEYPSCNLVNEKIPSVLTQLHRFIFRKTVGRILLGANIADVGMRP